MSELDGPVDPDDARELLAAGKARALDLRDPEQAADGHAPGAVIVGDRPLQEAAEEALAGEPVAILLFCEDGERSGEAAAELREQDIEAAAIEGGWSEWLSAGMPVQPRSDNEYKGPKLPTPGT